MGDCRACLAGTRTHTHTHTTCNMVEGVLAPCMACRTAGLRGRRLEREGEVAAWPEVSDCRREAVAWRLGGSWREGGPAAETCS